MPRPSRGETYLFLFVGLFALAFPIAGGVMAYKRFAGDKYLREHGIRVEGRVVGKQTRYYYRPAKGSDQEISQSEYESYSTGRQQRSPGSSLSVAYVIEYAFTGPNGASMRGQSRSGSSVDYNRLSDGSPVFIRYSPIDPAHNDTEGNVADTAGHRFFWSLAAVVLGVFCLPGLFFLRVAYLSARRRRNFPPVTASEVVSSPRRASRG